jgi:cytochrome P450
MTDSAISAEVLPLPSRRLPPTPKGGLRDMVRDPLGYFLSITREYGDIVCYRPTPDTAYLVNHPDFVHHVLVANHRNYSKDTYSNQAFKRAIGAGLINFEGDEWRARRRLMQPAFQIDRLEALDKLIVQATSEALLGWQHRHAKGQPVDVAREMAGLTMRITCQAFFGIDLGAEVYTVGELINGVATLLQRPDHPRLQKAVQEYAALADRIVAQRRRDSSGQHDLMGMLLSADAEDGGALDDRQLRNEVMGLLLAGHETTANALTWTFYLLSQNPWASERMRQEVLQVIGTRAPTAADVPGLPYARMVFDESLRLYPPAWIMGRRAIGDDRIGGYDVPAGTVVAICLYTLHRHPGFWEHPDRFDPERFTPERSADRVRYAFLPFSGGPRQCIRSRFAQLEAGLILACVAQLRCVCCPARVHPQALFVRPDRDMLFSLHP